MRTPACNLAFNALRSKSGSCALRVTVDLPLRLQESQTTTSAAGRGRKESAGCLVRLKRREGGNGRRAPQLELAQHHRA